MTVRIYKSTDASAPILNGTTGSLEALLNVCLVTGYGSQAGAGWTSPYYDAASKTRVFKVAGDPTAYLQVKDAGPGAGSFREARIRGYEAMSDYQTGSGLFPTAAQYANGMYVRKSSTLDATAREWVIAADERRIYAFFYPGDAAFVASHWLFGAMQSDKPNDLYPFVISGRIVENIGTLTVTQEISEIRNATLAATGAGYLMRSYTGVGTAQVIGFYGDSARSLAANTTHGGTSGIVYPCPSDGGLYMGKTFVNELNVPRGTLPGIWVPCHNKPLYNGDVFDGVEGLIGRSFLVATCGAGQLFLETSDTWDV